ncbi:hypothetical protein [Psychroserpens sp.]|nr:hypothetical protein [Psychroserpens sp.]MBO6605721.1 hypothetical protein [Psychroserpens sp.]MBO6630301.1 hypothetical protein [Psychroserpens sp.]MBO6652908.1 hypothetical protein [Psychroserpens sp.]MBO6681320.1 hypothetical protein [Psychroserpens sp.]MBO6749095.1 hypothetical protein [Psychroserpens sp.]
MKRSHQIILYAVLAGITIYGFLSGKFLFLVFVIPLGFGFFRKSNPIE